MAKVKITRKVKQVKLRVKLEWKLFGEDPRTYTEDVTAESIDDALDSCDEDAMNEMFPEDESAKDRLEYMQVRIERI